MYLFYCILSSSLELFSTAGGFFWCSVVETAVGLSVWSDEAELDTLTRC